MFFALPASGCFGVPWLGTPNGSGITIHYRNQVLMQKSPDNPPPIIGGGRLLYYAILGKSIRYSGRKLVFVGDAKTKKLKELKKVPCVAIVDGVTCLGKEEKELGLMYCNRDWHSIAYAPYPTVEEAMHRAERMYPGVEKLWIKAKATRKRINEYIANNSCSFCGNVKPALIKHIIKNHEGVAICNFCIDVLYHGIHARKKSNKSA